MKSIKIGNRLVTEESGPFIIAEAGVNYYDIAKKEKIEPYDAALLMIDAAVESGADAIKFQSYKAENLASIDSPPYWDTTKEPTHSQFELFSKFDKFNKEDYENLSNYCKKKNIIFLSTPFDFDSADYLEQMMPVYKISSSDITTIPFIKHIAKKKKPILLSTGASTIEEIEVAISSIISCENHDISILHCVLNYPTKYSDANLGMISSYRSLFPEYIIGYSDHTMPDPEMLVLTTAFLLGARILEKHFTLDKTLSGNDHYHAMDPKDLKKVRKNIHFIKNLLGDGTKSRLDNEASARINARRSIVASKYIPQNTVITADMVTFKRPGTGISPTMIDIVVGSTSIEDIQKDEIIKIEKIRK